MPFTLVSIISEARLFPASRHVVLRFRATIYSYCIRASSGWTDDPTFPLPSKLFRFVLLWLHISYLWNEAVSKFMLQSGQSNNLCVIFPAFVTLQRGQTLAKSKWFKLFCRDYSTNSYIGSHSTSNWEPLQQFRLQPLQFTLQLIGNGFLVKEKTSSHHMSLFFHNLTESTRTVWQTSLTHREPFNL